MDTTEPVKENNTSSAITMDVFQKKYREAVDLIKEMHRNCLYKISPEDDRPTHLPSELFDKVEDFLEKCQDERR